MGESQYGTGEKETGPSRLETALCPTMVTSSEVESQSEHDEEVNGVVFCPHQRATVNVLACDSGELRELEGQQDEQIRWDAPMLVTAIRDHGSQGERHAAHVLWMVER